MGSGNNKVSTTNEPGEAGANQSNSEENIPSTSGKHAITYFFSFWMAIFSSNIRMFNYT